MAAAETAATKKLTEKHRVLTQQKAEERAFAEKRAAEVEASVKEQAIQAANKLTQINK